ncbi:hypothetical protein GWK47_001422 [Chionoecetes opilio]|uniref:Uncharacterized protein n=1 Tax=Chionoecetes opilio TaxID=41210 RepID=A0A8J4XVS3_CHIOP|nr:hypothetical protein GWK47_001422 [Chionoecetes opilio]
MPGTAVGAPSHGPLSTLPKGAERRPVKRAPHCTHHTALAAADTGAGSAQTPGNGNNGQVPGMYLRTANVPKAAKVQGGGDEPPQRQLNLAGREGVPFKARAVRVPHRRHDERVLQYRVPGGGRGYPTRITLLLGSLLANTMPRGWPSATSWRVGRRSSVAPGEGKSPEGETSPFRASRKLALQPPQKS